VSVESTIETFRARDGAALRYTLRRTGAGRVLLVVPGILTHRDSAEHRLLAMRLEPIADVATLDVRGHGDSEGAFSWGLREPDDVSGLALHLRTRYRRVGAIGFSFGGYHVAVAAGRSEVGPLFDAAALVAAPARLFILDHNFLTPGLLRSLPLMARRRRRWTRMGYGGLRGRDTPLRLVHRIGPTPLLIAHGTADWLVPPKHSRWLHARASEPRELLLIEGGLHAEYLLSRDPERLVGPLQEFFGRYL